MNNERFKDQVNDIKDKAKNFASSAVHESAEGVKSFAEGAEKNMDKAMGKDSFQQMACSVDKQVRQNPWAAVLGAAAGGLLLGFLMSTSGRRS